MTAFSGRHVTLMNVNIDSGDDNVPTARPMYSGGKRSWKKQMMEMRHLATEERIRVANVSTPPPPTPSIGGAAAAASMFLPHATFFAIGATRPRDPTAANGPPSASWADDIPEPAAPILSSTAAPAPRDLSSLRSDNPHPWRSLRRRKRRLHPRQWHFYDCLEPTPIPSQPSVVVPPTSLTARPVPIANLIDAPAMPVRRPVAPILTTEPTVPEVLPRPLESGFPVDTAYGPVKTRLALACAEIYPSPEQVLYSISGIAFDYDVPRQSCHTSLLQLPPTQLVFLGVIAKMINDEISFAPFFGPALAWFVHISEERRRKGEFW